MSTLRKIKMLPITIQLCENLRVDYTRIVSENISGVYIEHLFKVFTAMTNTGLLPADAKLSFLYFDPRFNCWAILIESEMYEELEQGVPAPLLDLE